MTDFPDDRDDEAQEREDFREEWFEIAEDELVAEDEISASDTGDGEDPADDLIEDALDEQDDEMMHIEGEDEADED